MADFTRNEMMTIVAARALKNDDVCFVGIGAPSAACNVARLIHAQRADREGNVLIEGITGCQKEVVLASRRTIVTVEEMVDRLDTPSFNSTVLPHWTVGAIAVVKGGAHPSYAQGYYKRDNSFYIAWDKISRDRDTFLAWMKDNVLDKTPDAFAAHAKRSA